MRDKFTNSGWRKLIGIKRYSSGGHELKSPLYKILNPLGEGLKADRPVAKFADQLWGYFTHDPVLEAKLRLLQMIVNGESSPGSGVQPLRLEPALQLFQPAFDEFSRKDSDILGLFQNSQLSPEQKQEAFNEYREAFEKFRETLNVRFHA